VLYWLLDALAPVLVATTGSGLSLGQGLAEVGEQVLRPLDAAADPDQVGGDAEPLRSSGLIPACEVVAGRVISVSTPPRLGATYGS
jgi:hypothetical protein